MINMIRKLYFSPDVPDDIGAAPTPQEDSAPVTEPATSPDMTNYVSRSEYDNLQTQFNRSEGRAKTSQRLLSLAQEMGYNDADSFAEALPGLVGNQKHNSTDTPENQYSTLDEQRPSHRESPTLDDIDERISQRLGYQQAMNTHNLGREAEMQLITSIINDENFTDIFKDIEKGDFNNVFDAAYSGAGSAASEIVASAIDNVMYGMSSKYGDDSPESLQGKTKPITDPEVLSKVQSRVVEGLKELAAMSVFAASKKGLQTAPSPEMIESEGTEIPRKDTLTQLGENVEKFSAGRFDDLMASGMPSSS